MKSYTMNILEPSESDVEQPLVESKSSNFVAIKRCAFRGERLEIGDIVPNWPKSTINRAIARKLIKKELE